MNSPTTPKPNDAGLPAPKPAGWFRLSVNMTIVAAVFGALVGLLLLVDYWRRPGNAPLSVAPQTTATSPDDEDPVMSPQFVALKDQLRNNPQDDELRQQIRGRDLELRQQYFRHLNFAQWGAYLLLGGIVLALVAAKLAATIRRKRPMPGPYVPPVDKLEPMARNARWMVGAVAAVAIATPLILHADYRVKQARLKQQLASLPKSDDGKKTDPDGPGKNGKKPLPNFPTDEELVKNWHRFRGPHGSGISAYDNIPVRFNGKTGEGILWKTEVPLPGKNSPVVWGNHVFLTGATEKRREVYCFDAHSGQLLWHKDVLGTPLSEEQVKKITNFTGFAAPTATTDGRRVFAMFASGDVVALDFAGNQRWFRSLAVPNNSYGHAASLAMYQDLLIVQFDQGSKKDGLSKLLALKADTGETAWETSRKVPNSWPSPIVIEHEGRPQIITAADPWVIAYAPKDGKELWRADCLRADVGPSPVFADGVVYVANVDPAASAIRADGEGDVTDTHVLWQGEDGLPDCSSPLVTDQFALLAASIGVLTCYDAKNGEYLWEADFDGNFTSSPGMAGGLLYLFDQDGKVWIVRPTKEKCETITETELGEECVTSPAFLDGRIYIRGKKHLFCIGES